jgi:hypothetical protein
VPARCQQSKAQQKRFCPRFTLKLKVTPVKKILIASLLLGTTPAYAWVDRAPTTEYHDLWGMQCFPVDNVPFHVTTNDKAGGVLLIEGAHGVIRSNDIEEVKNIHLHGVGSMVIIANGFDYNGHHREIELHVSKQAGMLAVNRDIEHGIPCGPAVGVSDD